MKKSLIPLIAAAGLMAVTTGCGDETVVKEQSDITTVSFSWWGNDDRHDYTLQAIKEFEELNPDIKVKCNYSEWSGYQARNNVQMVSHTESDVMQINYAWLNQYSPDGSGYYDISQLSEYVDLSNFTEEDLEYGMQNGRLNAIPIALNTMTVYINKSVYGEYGLDVPKNWDDLYTAAAAMKGEHYPVAMTKKSAWFYIISYVGQLRGKDFIDDSGNILFDRDDISLMIDTYCDMVEKKVMPQVEYFDKLEIASGGYGGVVAWLSDAQSYCGGAVSNGYEMVVADYTTLDGKLESWYAKPATMYAIRKDIENPEAAARLLDYLLNSTEMASYQKIEKGTPLSSSARAYLEENELLGGIQYEAFNRMTDAREELEIISPYFENDAMIDAFFNVCNEVLYDRSESDDQAAELLKELNKISKN